MKTIEQIALEVAQEMGANAMCKDPVGFAAKVNAAWLAQQEPVAWCYVQSGYTHYTDDKRDWYDAPGIEEVTPLFLAPPPAVPEGYVLVQTNGEES